MPGRGDPARGRAGESTQLGDEAMKKADNKDALKFEEAMTQLEEVVRKLEAGDVPLEDSLAAFERGVALVRLLHARLDAVQEKIEELMRTDKGELATKPFESE
jgi:exodeoxyribonuclease VII small subunit